MKKALRLPVVYLALFVSGGAALVYQVTWGRMLHRVFGVSDQAVATVLAAFFLGLGIGAALGGRLGTRFRRAALTYAALEAGVGVLALMSLWLIPHVHGIYAALGAGAAGSTLTAIRLGLALALLLPPTILMGATLPVLIALLAPQRETWSTPATWLYATNTLGAMVGAGLSGRYLAPMLGSRMSIVVAAVASLGGAALVAAVWRGPSEGGAAARADGNDDDEDAAAAAPHAADAPGSGLVIAMVIAGVAGAAALASEVLWTRVLRIVVVGTSQSFSAMLVNYLAGIALGSLIAAELMRRGHRASVLLGASQVLLGLLTVVAMGVAAHLPRVVALLQRSDNMVPHQLWVILLVSGLLLFPIALVLGTSIPLCWRLARSSSKQAPQHAGRILAANTLGGLVGSLLAGFIAVPLLGVEASLLAVMFVHLIVGGVALQIATGRGLVRRVVAMAGPVALGMLLLGTGPTLHLPYLLAARLEPTQAILAGPDDSWWGPLELIEEGRSTTVTVLASSGELRLYNDGRPEGALLSFEPGIASELVVLGGLPSLYAEHRERAMVIGLGAGHTATMLLAGPWRDVHVVELEEAVARAARFMHERRGKASPLDDPRARLTVDDARAQLVLAQGGSLDAVVSQPSHPWLAGSSALYTQELFEEVRRVLRPGGIFALWVNLFRARQRHVSSILTTLRTVFPHIDGYVVESGSLILIASGAPLRLGARARDRYEEMGLGRFLLAAGLDGFAQLAAMRELQSGTFVDVDFGGEIIVDDRPMLEHELARLPRRVRLDLHDLDVSFSAAPWITPSAWAEIPEDRRLELIIRRLDRISPRPLALDRFEDALVLLEVTEAERAIARGGLAAARGDVDEALERFDAVEDRHAATVSDQLRLYLGRIGPLLVRSQVRQVGPSDPSALISAALALAEPEALQHALVTARSTAVGRTSKSLPVLEAMVQGGCDAVLELGWRVLADAEDVHGLLLGQRCAARGDRRAHFVRLGDEHARLRRGLAARATETGLEHQRYGNLDGAVMHFERALATDPSNDVAAISLARLEVASGHREDAARILVAASRATRGLPNAARVVAAAAEMGIVVP